MHELYYSAPLDPRYQSIPASVSCGRNNSNNSTLAMEVTSICHGEIHFVWCWKAFCGWSNINDGHYFPHFWQSCSCSFAQVIYIRVVQVLDWRNMLWLVTTVPVQVHWLQIQLWNPPRHRHTSVLSIRVFILSMKTQWSRLCTSISGSSCLAAVASVV